MTGRVVLTIAVIGVAAGCSALTPSGCDSILQVRVSPTSRTIVVGESFTAEAEFLGCGGSRHLDDQITWTSQDSLIARVEAATGRVVGRAAGATSIEVHGAISGTTPSLLVTVR